MKNKILLACLIGLINITSVYASCDGGTMVGGFCKSNVSMNWWSAAAWCQANGLHLATIYEICPNWDGNIGPGCPQWDAGGGNIFLWSSTASGYHEAFYTYQDGNIDHGYYYRNTDGDATYKGYAFCK